MSRRARDLDAARIGLWGVSLGGYYAPRAAAFEKRIKACIALAGPYDWDDRWDGLPELTREAFRVRSHCADAGRGASATPRRCRSRAWRENITCPMFIVTGKLDRLIPWQRRRAARARGERPVRPCC